MTKIKPGPLKFSPGLRVFGWSVVFFTASMYLLGLYQCGVSHGETGAFAEMRIEDACKWEHSVLDDFMATEAKELAYSCHDVAICLRVDGQVKRCDAVTCETAGRCKGEVKP